MGDSVDPAGGDLDVEAGAVLLAELREDVRGAERLLARAVVAAGRLAGSGVAERVQGLTVDMVLATACRLTGADRGMLLTAGETLRTMPATTRLFCDGELSWGQVRRIVGAARTIPAAARGELDERIAATGQAHGLDRYDPDDLCDQVDAAADELRRLRTVERAETRRADADVLVVQQTFDGMVTGWFRLNVVSAAIVVNALTHWTALLATGSVTPPQTGGTPAATDADDADDPGAWTGRDRGRQHATALVTLAAAALSGLLTPHGARRPAKPLYVLHVDVRHAHPTATLELDLAGRLPSLTARTVELLGSDATIQAVLFDGHRPLAVSSKRHADHIPADTRLAVQARDLGNRDPGPRLPVSRAQLHHLTHRNDGGDHHVDNLACIGPAWHLRHVHPKNGDGWHGRIDPTTGTITSTRHDQHIQRLPRGTPLPPPGHVASPRGHPPTARSDPPTTRGHPPTAGGDPPAPADPPQNEPPLPF